MNRIKGISRFRSWPVRWQITCGSAILTFAILLIFGAAVGHLVSGRVRSDFNRDLQQSASGLVSRTRIVERAFSQPVVVSPELKDASLPNDAAAQIVNASGEVEDRTASHGVDFGRPNPGISTHGSFAVATAPITGPESQIVGYVQYGRSTDAVSSTITKLWVFIVGGVLGGTVLAVFAGLALASRAMKPVASLTATAREIASTQDTSHRLPEPTTDDEVGELTYTLQQMLTALDDARTDREATLQKQREFVADASHELRTPLTSVLANLELLEAQLTKIEAADEERELVSSAVRSSRRMSRLVSDLLVLARSDAGQKRPRSECDLAAIAASAAREVVPKLGGRVLDTGECRQAAVHGNRDEIHRLILNLLDNAILYSPPGAHISLRTRVEAGLARVEVADSGPGIPAEMRELVFDRFVRIGIGADTNPADGTGLGLAMVKAIAVDHGGTAQAESSETLGGAKIVVSFPLNSTRLDESETEPTRR